MIGNEEVEKDEKTKYTKNDKLTLLGGKLFEYLEGTYHTTILLLNATNKVTVTTGDGGICGISGIASFPIRDTEIGIITGDWLAGKWLASATSGATEVFLRADICSI